MAIQVPLGIVPKCETKHEDMVSILETLHEYVPTQTTMKEIDTPDGIREAPADHFHYLLFDGDLLTVKRARGGRDVRCVKTIITSKRNCMNTIISLLQKGENTASKV